MRPDYTIYHIKNIFLLLSVGIFLVNCTQEKCETIIGSEDLVKPGNVVLLGEIHGTQEGPAFVEHLACNALQNDLPVTIGLELPQSDQKVIDSFLQSDGSAKAGNQILDLNFWARDYQDGRASQAMFDLIDWVRKRKRKKENIEIILIDQPASKDRDFEMAQRVLAEVEKKPSDFYVVLTGNIHKMINKGSGRMGTYVQEKLGKSKVKSFNQVYSGGSAWVCLGGGGCGPVQFGGERRGTEGIFFDDKLNDYDGIFDVDSIHASRPAKERLKQ